MSEDKYKVVVVGAGLAGLAAANALVSSGKLTADDVSVLEAQSRIGGRIHTRAFSDVLPAKVEAGAAWIHGTKGNPMVALARKFGIELRQVSARNPWLHPSSCPNFLLFEGSRQLTDQEAKQTWEWQELLLQKLQIQALEETMEHTPLNVVVEQLLTEDNELSNVVAFAKNAKNRLLLCLHLVETWMGSTSEELQIDAFGEIDLMGDDPGAHCIVPDGVSNFIDHLSAPVKSSIHTSACVSSINYEGEESVVVKCLDGRQVSADHVVVTCSLGFLKSGKLCFQPELPVSKVGAITRSQMGQCMKVLLQFSEAFWPKDATFIGQIDDTSDPRNESRQVFFPVMFSYLAAKGIPILEGDLVGEKVCEISANLSDDEIARTMFQQLQDTFGTEIPEPVDHFVTRWDRDEWSRGAYSSVTVDSSFEDPDLLREAVKNRVYFAGEATNYEYQGALQAAYLSGHQAADDIVARLPNKNPGDANAEFSD